MRSAFSACIVACVAWMLNICQDEGQRVDFVKLRRTRKQKQKRAIRIYRKLRTIYRNYGIGSVQSFRIDWPQSRRSVEWKIEAVKSEAFNDKVVRQNKKGLKRRSIAIPCSRNCWRLEFLHCLRIEPLESNLHRFMWWNAVAKQFWENDYWSIYLRHDTSCNSGYVEALED